MKKTLLLLFTFTSILFAQFSGGTGTIGDPYQIATKTDLKTLSDSSIYLDKNFIQTADIYFTSADYLPTGDFYYGGSFFSPIGNLSIVPFTGSYNGQNHTIDSLKINRGTEDGIGFFGKIFNTAAIQNLGITNINVIGKNFVGGLAGSSDVYCTVTNSYTTGNVSGNTMVGGLVGLNEHYSTVTNSYSSGNVSGVQTVGGLVGYNYDHSTVTNSYSTSSVIGNDNVGGLIAYNYDNTVVANSYSTGSVIGINFVGGLAGSSFASIITNSYSTGSVVGSTSVGGLLGNNLSTAVTNSFWDINTSGLATSAGGTGLPTVSMQTQSTFTSATWDFIGEVVNGTYDYWVLPACTNGNYPKLSWQTYYFIDSTINATITASGSTTLCDGDSIDITSTIGDNYLWSTGATSNPIIVTYSDTVYVQIQSNEGCISDTSNIIIISDAPVPATPTISASGTTTFCDGGSVNISSTAGDNYLWNTGATTNSITVSNSDTVFVQIESTEGCTSDTSNIIIVSEIDCSGIEEENNIISIYPNPTSNFITIQTNEKIQSIQIMDMMGKKMNTYPNITTIDISYLNDGVYVIEVSTPHQTLKKKIIKQ